jgi:structural maintenance of chromosome 4
MDATHLKKLEMQVKAFEKDHAKAADRAGEVESEVKRLHDEIMEVGGARLKPQQAMVDKLVKEIDDANAVITKATVGIKTNERDVKKCSDKISSLERDLASTQAKLEDLKAVLTQLEEEATVIVARQKEIEGELKEKEVLMKKKC